MAHDLLNSFSKPHKTASWQVYVNKFQESNDEVEAPMPSRGDEPTRQYSRRYRETTSS